MAKCFVCEGDSSFYCKWNRFDYVKCTNCDLVYLNQMPTEAEIYTAYEGSKLKSLRRKITAPFRSLEQLSGYKERVADFDKKLKLVLPFIDSKIEKNALDLGCNKCFYLEAAVKNGFTPWGVELIPEMTLQFKRKYKQYAANIFTEDFSKVSQGFENEKFAIISAFDLVEHLRNPAEDFKNIFRILKKGGIFFLQTPNTDSPEAKELKEKWGAIKAYEHYQLFNEKNLTQFAKKIGFTKVDFLDPKLSQGGDMLAILTK